MITGAEYFLIAKRIGDKFESKKFLCQFASIWKKERSSDGDFLVHALLLRSADTFYLRVHESAAKAEYESV